MAYNENGMRIGAAGHFASRLTAALIAAGGIQPTAEEAADTFADLTAKALDVLNGLEAGGATAPAFNAEASIRSAFPDTETVAIGLRVIGQQGELPDWLAPAAAGAGVTAVYDNRKDLAANPKRPWFKQAEPASGNPKGFWPPK